MKTIVLAADFSESAAQVADYALALAGQLYARLVIVHVYEPSADGPTEFSYIPLRLERLRERLMHSSKGSVEIAVVAKYGEPKAGIEAVVTEQQADLLIMALADDRPYTARFLGSLPTNMIPQTAISMLILPPGIHYKVVKMVVLAIDLSEAIDAIALGKAKSFVQEMGASLAVICMDDDPDSQRREAAQHVQGLFEGLPHTFSFLPGNDLTTTLDEYCSAHPTDLIMLLPKYHSNLSLWLRESVTQQVARQAVVPVLAVV
jgi:nucleotide-binding universal stress UspA family protein